MDHKAQQVWITKVQKGKMFLQTWRSPSLQENLKTYNTPRHREVQSLYNVSETTRPQMAWLRKYAKVFPVPSFTTCTHCQPLMGGPGEESVSGKPISAPTATRNR